jgi:NADPH-dependent glutamate synthase beta subunit-like oxidoreductase
MKPFNHINATSLQDAMAALNSGNASVIAGGTDLLGALKDSIFPDYPSLLVNVKSIPGLDFVREEDGALVIGAAARLSDIAEHPSVKEKYTALAQAAGSVATPHLRSMGTIGGSITQLPRCWYFRKLGNRFHCRRKNGEECFAILGDSRYHSIFGGIRVGAAPCAQSCPAGTDIPAYLAAFRAGDWDKAARTIMSYNPMPAITSRVCVHFCQQGCNRRQTDESVLACGIERVLGDYILENSGKFYAPPENETGKSIAVAGAGAAGLAAAYFLRRTGHGVTVYDDREEAGGMLMYAIPAYRLPKEIVRRFVKALENMGVVFKTGAKTGGGIKLEEGKYDSVLFATGAWKRPIIGIAGEELTIFGLDFLVEINKWMDGKAGSEVIVAGGGNVAIDVAVTAKRLGVEKVTLACLEPGDLMPASAEEVKRAEQEGVVIMPSWGLSKVVSENGIVRGMELKRCVSVWDENGAFNPQYDESEKTVVYAENILIAAGQSVDLSFFDGLDEKYRVALNRHGLIDVAEETQMTSREGIFAAGDATTGPDTVIGAVAGARRASEGINRYLDANTCGSNNKNVDCDFGAINRAPAHEEFISHDTEGITNGKALKLRELDADKRRLDLEDSQTPDKEEAIAEARRCLNCGCYAMHPSDVAPALIALDAKIITSIRAIDAEDFFAVRKPGNTILEHDEIITEIRIPEPPAGTVSAFIKFALRKAIDFPLVNCAVMIGGDNPRICLGAVAPRPYRAYKAEAVIAGKKIDEALARAAGEAAVIDAKPFPSSRYKVQIAKTLVKRSLLSVS